MALRNPTGERANRGSWARFEVFVARSLPSPGVRPRVKVSGRAAGQQRGRFSVASNLCDLRNNKLDVERQQNERIAER